MTPNCPQFPRRTVVVLLLLLATSGFLEAEEPRLRIAAVYNQTAVLLGEPIEVEVTLEWENPNAQGVLATNTGFLAINIEDEAGRRIEQDPYSRQMIYEMDPVASWPGASITMSHSDPSWARRIVLNRDHRLPVGSYSVSYAWSTPEISKDDEGKIRKKIVNGLFRGKEAPDILIWKGSGQTTITNLTVECPTVDADMAAYQILAGGSCPDVFLNPTKVLGDSEEVLEVLRDVPASKYAGYRFLSGWGLLDFESQRYEQYLAFGETGSFAAFLMSGWLFTRFPEIRVSVRNYPTDGGTLRHGAIMSTRVLISRHQEKLSSFVQANPGFFARGNLEYYLALDSLALGDISRAEAHLENAVTLCVDNNVRDQAMNLVSGLEETIEKPQVVLDVASSTDYLVGEPIQIDVSLSWRNPIPAKAVVTDMSFVTVEAMSGGGLLEVNPYVVDSHGRPRPEWGAESVFLTLKTPGFTKSLRLDRCYPNSAPGDLGVTISLVSKPIDDEARAVRSAAMSLEEPFRRIELLDGFQAEVPLDLSIRCPTEPADVEFFRRAAGGPCPGAFFSSVMFDLPSGDQEKLLNELPESRYSAYILAKLLPDCRDWRVNCGTPASVAALASAPGSKNELEGKALHLFNLVENHLRNGNPPLLLKPQLWDYYGENLLSLGRTREAKDALSIAVGEGRRDFFSERADRILTALSLTGSTRAPASK